MAVEKNPSRTSRTNAPETVRSVRVRQAAARAAVSASAKTGRAVDPRVKRLAESSGHPTTKVHPTKAVPSSSVGRAAAG